MFQLVINRHGVPCELTTNRLNWKYEYWVEACALPAAPVVVVVVEGRPLLGLSLICPVHIVPYL